VSCSVVHLELSSISNYVMVRSRCEQTAWLQQGIQCNRICCPHKSEIIAYMPCVLDGELLFARVDGRHDRTFAQCLQHCFRRRTNRRTSSPPLVRTVFCSLALYGSPYSTSISGYLRVARKSSGKFKLTKRRLANAEAPSTTHHTSHDLLLGHTPKCSIEVERNERGGLGHSDGHFSTAAMSSA
jgi:hypothetical protein